MSYLYNRHLRITRRLANSIPSWEPPHVYSFRPAWQTRPGHLLFPENWTPGCQRHAGTDPALREARCACARYLADLGGTFANNEPRPSAIVGCVKMASRSPGIGHAGQHRRLHHGHHLTGLRAEHGEAQDAVALRVDEGLHEAAASRRSSASAARHSSAAWRRAPRPRGGRPRVRSGRHGRAAGR